MASSGFEFVPLEEKPVSDSDIYDAKKRQSALNGKSFDDTDSEAKTYTVEDAVEAAGFGRFQLLLCVICGVLMAADAMEMLLLSILGPALRCSWLLSSEEIAAITTVVFAGFLIGSPIWGFVSDRFGRWPTFFTVLTLISYYGFLTAVSPTYVWVLILRFTVGFAIGGCSSSFALLSEFLPVKYRAKVLLGFQIFWAIGSTFEVGIAYLILPRFGWRWLVFASALPLALFLGLMKLLPESPRYLVTAGYTVEAEKVIARLFRTNRATPIEGKLTSTPVSAKSLGSVKQLFGKRYLITTLMLPMIWFGAAFGYYGVVLLSAEIFRFRHSCFGAPSTPPEVLNATLPNDDTPPVDTSCCRDMNDDDFVAMLVSSVGEFINVPLMVLVIDCFGRKITMGVWNGLTGLMFFLLYVCMSKEAMTGVLFVVRAFSAGLLSLAYLYTTEVYPTSCRAIAVGSFSSISRVGAIVTPYVAQVMMPEVSQIGALSLYAAVGVLSSILAFSLPIETAGRELPSHAEEIPVEYPK
ncbi:Synaptic vesicle 2- protein [Clonorchis sinensis]|uniref:Synaptic vesicle 2- protein n=1 Tax=Clonorchis sinensis TaxID=79923 RepID=A0A8T1M756_CLOSI|nr:Synaptic vesicle 2- protein [Clonorchis sinensis]